MDKDDVVTWLTKEERETFLRANDLGDDWEFWTLSPIWARKMERTGYKLERDRQGGWSCRVPQRFVTIRKPINREKRILTDEERQIRLERLQKAYKARSECRNNSNPANDL